LGFNSPNFISAKKSSRKYIWEREGKIEERSRGGDKGKSVREGGRDLWESFLERIEEGFVPLVGGDVDQLSFRDHRPNVC
jgi:hypothetical protein